jgi:quinolinate synthase
LKAFVGQHGGAVCTSSNARAVLTWALDKGEQVLFFPDQHLGRNTGYDLGYGPDDMRLWNPRLVLGGLTDREVKESTLLLWKGHCSVHQRFLPEHVDKVRAKYPGMQIIVHPECRWEVCQKADGIGSTDYLIKKIKEAPSGSAFAVGTEIHLVNRLAKEHADKHVMTLDDSGCLCTTMFRISPQHLCWALENLVEGNVVNPIRVKDSVKRGARVALDRMLEIQ